MSSKMKKMLVLMFMFILMLGLAVGCASGDSVPSGNGGNNEDVSDDNNEATQETGNDEATQEDGEQIELRMAWWGSQTRHDYTLEAIEIYEEKNPQITIDPEFSGWDGYWEMLATQAAGGDLPDIIQMDMQYI